MHYYQHNIGDYRRDTVHLSLLEHGVYRQLLDMYYLSESPIPRETQQVIRRLSARTQDEISAIEIILDEFFTLTDEGWIHKRCDMEIANYRHKAENSRNNGKKGGRPKSIPEPKKTQQVISGNPEHNLNEPERINALTNKPINLLKSLKAIDRKSDDFDHFWNLYPKKTGKLDAAKAWKKVSPNLPEIIKAIKWQVMSRQWMEGYIPNPSTYLNQGRWLDEPANERTTKPDILMQKNKNNVDEWVPPEMRGSL